MIQSAPVVSIVMPCLNEANGVGRCVEAALGALKDLGLPGEVIVVDNGSTDGSPDIAKAAGARVVPERRRGYGSAYLRGFQESRGQYLVMGDADGSYDFRDLRRFVEPLRTGRFDMVMGNRLGGTILPGAMPWTHRWIGNPILSGMLKLFFHTSISDSHCGLRSFTREAYERMHLRTTGMEFASEIVVNALRENFRIQEVPITYFPREGTSKLRSLSDAWRHFRFMLLFSPSYLFQLPGIALMLTGALLIVLLARGPRVLFGHQWDFHVLLFGALSLILGYDFVLFDIFAKTFSMGSGLARPNRWLRALMRVFTLERGLLLGSLLVVTGFAVEVQITLEWMRSGYGTLMAVRGITVGMTLMVLGAQTLVASFLVSLLSLERR
jgi:glycosyltransferase involved in cell wall biosynthesis